MISGCEIDIKGTPYTVVQHSIQTSLPVIIPTPFLLTENSYRIICESTTMNIVTIAIATIAQPINSYSSPSDLCYEWNANNSSACETAAFQWL